MWVVVIGFGRDHLQQRHRPAFNSQAGAQDKMATLFVGVTPVNQDTWLFSLTKAPAIAA